MTYSVKLLMTNAECDLVLEMAKDEKADLEYRKAGLERRKESYEDRSSKIAVDKTSAESELQAVKSIIGNLPTGSDMLDDMQKRQKKLEYQLFLLEERSENYGVTAILNKEMELALVEKQIAEIDNFLQAVETHKATL